jgi:hypothetical protein
VRASLKFFEVVEAGNDVAVALFRAVFADGAGVCAVFVLDVLGVWRALLEALVLVRLVELAVGNSHPGEHDHLVLALGLGDATPVFELEREESKSDMSKVQILLMKQEPNSSVTSCDGAKERLRHD